MKHFHAGGGAASDAEEREAARTNGVQTELRADARTSELVEAFLRLAGHIHEDHRDQVAGVPVAGAGDDDAGAMHFLAVDRRLQDQPSFRSKRESACRCEIQFRFCENEWRWQTRPDGFERW